jgi:PAS domain S-box-containing protein
MLSEPVRRAALEKARDSGGAVLTGKVTLIFDSSVQSGALMYLPVYRTRPRTSSVEERRSQLLGWIYASFRMIDLIHGIFGRQAPELGIEIYDGTTPSEATLLSDNAPPPQDRDRVPRFHAELPLEVAGHRWTMTVRSESAFEARQDAEKQRLIAATGTAAGALMALLVWILAQGRVGAMRHALEQTRRAEERRRSEQALREADERLHSTLKDAGAGTWEWDVATNTMAWSPENAELFEWAASDRPVAPADWERCVHPDDLGAAKLAVRRPLDGGDQAYVAEYRVRNARLGWRWLLSTGRVQRAPDGTPVRVLGLNVDITQRKDAEGALRRSERFYRAVLKSSADFWSVLDREGRYRRVGSSVSAVVGWSEEELRAQDRLENVHPEDRDGLAATWQSLLSEPGATRHATYRFRHKDGSWRVLHTDARNLLDDPDVQGVVVNRRDATEQRRLEEQLQQAQRLESIGQLAGGVAHDFNNILTVILSCAGEIGEDLAAGVAARQEHVKEIVSSSERARDLTRQLLAFARKQVIEPVPLDLNHVVRGSEKLLRRILGEDVVLAVDPQPELWAVKCDAGQLEQVILNVAVNARDAMPAGGRLTIETRNVALESDLEAAPGEYVRLVVRDSGVGMTPEVKAHLFEPFFTTKPQGQGTGLGLATVYGIVKQSEGHIRVQSEPGQGSRFEILLPRTKEAVPPARPAASTAARGGHETVLVVEDEPLVQKVTVRALRRGGYTVLVAGTGQEALALDPGALQGVKLLVTDVVMPSMDGRALADALRRHHPDLQVLYVSGYTRDAIAQRGVLDEGIEFLAKPFTSTALLARVRELLDGRASAVQ